MKILVVGGIGYIGSHMLKRFKETNYDIEIIERKAELVDYEVDKKITLKITNFMFVTYQIRKKFTKYYQSKTMIL